MSVILPGEFVELQQSDDNSAIVIGPGLKKVDNKIVAIKCGIIRNRNNTFYWLDSYQKRYVASRNEHVIGIIVMKAGESFKVDIGTSEYASLSYMAFENATKRNRPNIDIGDLVYAKVLTGEKDMEPELVCIDSDGKANGMGHLIDGFMFRASLDFCRRLLSTSCPLLRMLGKLLKFEVAIGLNGIIWVKTATSKETIFLSSLIMKYAEVSDADTEAFIKEKIEELK